MSNFTIVQRDIPMKVRIELDISELKHVVAPPGHDVSLVGMLLTYPNLRTNLSQPTVTKSNII